MRNNQDRIIQVLGQIDGKFQTDARTTDNMAVGPSAIARREEVNRTNKLLNKFTNFHRSAFVVMLFETFVCSASVAFGIHEVTFFHFLVESFI